MISKDKELINQHTRRVYHGQHTRMLNDETTRKRIMDISVSEDFFNLPNGWFLGKKVLDAGCGSIARNAINFCKIGADNVTAMDLGDQWFGAARKNMEQEGLDANSIVLTSGSVDSVPFTDESFDFVCCDGVLPHLADLQQVTDSINELCRIVMPGGYLFISWIAFGGLIETKICDAAREYYVENETFRNMVDNIQPEHIHNFLDYSVEFLNNKNTLVENDFIEQLKMLIDEDFCISLQNTLQCKRRECYSFELICEIVCKNGFSYPNRLKRYVKRNNLRKYFAPFHYDKDHIISRILYGEGYLDCIFHKEAGI